MSIETRFYSTCCGTDGCVGAMLGSEHGLNSRTLYPQGGHIALA